MNRGIKMRVLLFCLSLLCLPAVTCSAQAWRDNYQKAADLYSNDDFATAYDLAKKTLDQYIAENGEANDNYAAILRLLANITYADSKFEEGIQYMDREILIRENQPNELLAGALSNQALFYQQLEQYEKAIEVLIKANEILSQYYKETELPVVECRINLAFNYYFNNQNQKAYAIFQKNIPLLAAGGELSTEDLFGFYYFGMLQVDRGELQEAQKTLSKTRQYYESADLTESVEYALVISGLGVVLNKLQQFADAEITYSKAQTVYESLEMTNDELYLSLLNNRAINLQALGKDGEAQTLLAQIQSNPAGKSTLGAALSNSAAISISKGDYKTAEQQYKDALLQFDKTNPKEILGYVETEENFALLKSETGQPDEAIRLMDEAVTLIEQRFGSEHPRYATSLNKRARIKFNKRDFGEAEKDFSAALNTLTRINENSSEKTLSLSGLGQCAQVKGNYSLADSFYQQALDNYENGNLTKDKNYGILLNNYASSQQDQGNWADARDTEQEVVALLGRLQGKNHIVYAGALENLALLNLRLGEFTLAQTQLDSVLSIYQKQIGVESYEYAEAQLSMGRYHQYMGEYPVAEPLIKKAVQRLRTQKGEQSMPYANSLNVLALLYQTMGNFNEAEPALKEALSVYEIQVGKTSREYATSLQNLASLYQLEEKYQLAEPLLKEALSIDRSILGEMHPQYAISLQNLATIYQKQKKFDEATPLLENVKIIFEKTIGVEHPSYAVVISNLAALYQDKGEFDKAESYWKRSAEIRKNKLGENHPDYARSLYGLAGVYHATSKLVQAKDLYEQVVTKYHQQIDNYFSALSESEKSAFYSRIRPVFEAYQDFGIEYGLKNTAEKTSYAEKLFNLQLSTKAILLNASNKVRTMILSSGDQNLIDLYHQWQLTKENLVKYYNYSRAEREERQIDLAMLEDQSNELEKKLSQQSSLFGTHHDQKEITWRDVQKALKPGEAVVEIIRVRKKYVRDSIYYVGLVLHANSNSPEIVVWPNGQRLENRLFRYHRNTINFHFYDSISYNYFWKPMSPYVKDAGTIYFSCDGIFNKVNFNSLQNPTTKKFIIEDYTIRLVSNSRELIAPQTIQGNHSARLFGFADFNLAAANTTGSKRTLASRYGFEGEEIPILPATEDEIKILDSELKKKNWNTHLFIKEEASEKNLKALKDEELLHIATHGFFLSDVDFVDAPQTDNEEMEKFIRNPLFRSGILLAGASAGRDALGDEDGVLTAYEAMNLSLDKTQLVVLSACETGLGEIRNGEGVYGLQRSFIVAGAQAVMMSLWQVDDVATQELMTEFYSNWLGGEEKFQAFRKAQLTMKQKYETPFYWAAFVMVGH